MSFFAGLFLGVALAMVVLGFLAIDAYRRGYEEAAAERRVWRAELGARRLVARLPVATRHVARAAS
jgi:hypothetical protein